MQIRFSSAAVTGNKSRSIHNLTSGTMPNHMASASELHDQGFYQNLSIYRGQNISQPNLGMGQPMSPQHQQQQQQAQSTRPVSAYYPNATPQGMNGPMTYQMMPEHPQQTSFSNEAIAGQQAMMRGQMLPPQGGQNLNQMMAPSMPNIAHSSGYASNISASQSMQNVNQAQNYPVHYQPQFQQQQQQQQQLQQQQQAGQQQLRGQAKMAEMGELIRRKQQRDHNSQLDIQATGAAGGSPMMLSPNQSQKTILGPNMQMSPLRQLPPTAPKPMVRGARD